MGPTGNGDTSAELNSTVAVLCSDCGCYYDRTRAVLPQWFDAAILQITHSSEARPECGCKRIRGVLIRLRKRGIEISEIREG